MRSFKFRTKKTKERRREKNRYSKEYKTKLYFKIIASRYPRFTFSMENMALPRHLNSLLFVYSDRPLAESVEAITRENATCFQVLWNLGPPRSTAIHADKPFSPALAIVSLTPTPINIITANLTLYGSTRFHRQILHTAPLIRAYFSSTFSSPPGQNASKIEQNKIYFDTFDRLLK